MRTSDHTTSYTDRLNLTGRVFVVLGAGQGIGRETSHALSQAGGRIVCVDLDPTLADGVAAEVGGLGIAADVTSRSDVSRIFKTTLDQEGRVDGLVDIVGMSVGGPLHELDDEAWRRQQTMVLDHAFLALQIGGNAMAQSGGGAMVFVGSIAGSVTTGNTHGAYGIAKAALHQLVAYGGKERAAEGIRVNGVAPGITLTPRSASRFDEQMIASLSRLVPAGRLAQVPEIASVILFLMSDLATYVTGQVINADGGLAGTLRLDLA